MEGMRLRREEKWLLLGTASSPFNCLRSILQYELMTRLPLNLEWKKIEGEREEGERRESGLDARRRK